MAASAPAHTVGERLRQYESRERAHDPGALGSGQERRGSEQATRGMAPSVEHHVPAGKLRVEITEEVVMSDPVRAQAVLESLSAEGIPIALDDFGTGYSSLARLARLPVDELKIDRSFVAAMITHPGHAAIVRSTIHLAHDLGLTVVAEGIEHQAQWDRLAELGCDEAQGFLVSRPIPSAELEGFLLRRHGRAA